MKRMNLFTPRCVALLLFLGAAVYAVGAIAEASAVSSVPSPTMSSASPASNGGETGNETTEHKPTATRPASQSEAVAGFNPEGPLFAGLALLVFVGLGVAILVRQPRPLMVVAVVVALLATVLDFREVAHQLGEGRGLLVTIASVLIVVHLATAGSAAGALKDAAATS